MHFFIRWKYRFLVWFVDRPDALARRVRIESRLLNVVSGDAQPPTPEECRDWALELGVPSWARPNPRKARRSPGSFQARVRRWVIACFGPVIADDGDERKQRFLEEALELVQSLGFRAEDAHALVDYVFSRPAGEPGQEVGGVAVTFDALCSAHRLDRLALAETELARVWNPKLMDAIREKQKSKPAIGPLPGVYPERAGLTAQAER